MIPNEETHQIMITELTHLSHHHHELLAAVKMMMMMMTPTTTTMSRMTMKAISTRGKGGGGGGGGATPKRMKTISYTTVTTCEVKSSQEFKPSFVPLRTTDRVDWA